MDHGEVDTRSPLTWECPMTGILAAPVVDLTYARSAGRSSCAISSIENCQNLGMWGVGVGARQGFCSRRWAAEAVGEQLVWHHAGLRPVAPPAPPHSTITCAGTGSGSCCVVAAPPHSCPPPAILRPWPTTQPLTSSSPP